MSASPPGPPALSVQGAGGPLLLLLPSSSQVSAPSSLTTVRSQAPLHVAVLCGPDGTHLFWLCTSSGFCVSVAVCCLFCFVTVTTICPPAVGW